MTATRTLLITGATGTVSSALLDALEGAPVRLRALVTGEAAAETLRRRGVAAFVGDLAEPASCRAAFDGADDLWLLTPNDPRAHELSANAVRAAHRAGVGRVVRLSALRAAPDAPTRSERLHARADADLIESGLRWTILRPFWFMQNLLGEAHDVAAEGVLRLNMATSRLAMIDARDVAACAAVILRDDSDRHDGRTYTLTGPRAITFDEVAAALSAVCGRAVRYTPVSDDARERRLRASGVPEWIIGMLTEYAQAHVLGRGDHVSPDFEAVTGRRARTVTDFARDHAEVFTARTDTRTG
ncbi:uncharacterized protein YbjT (DUF2867 family) [Stackebrandtia albiflava]|uniref:Uncharacterized protein YbjT (DUF2867 family) n=1 Tax=Stackebrandtia albiflava TaxID=406432 RepID=A0A562VH71_9ACTN|nr:NAD(P)H-binding protein [Stackebrandtia albiflava]TWJ17181.1 uncharacterized protein YbjT (DUF2867 family) [Stackebrandtia albiflava]